MKYKKQIDGDVTTYTMWPFSGPTAIISLIVCVACFFLIFFSTVGLWISLCVTAGVAFVGILNSYSKTVVTLNSTSVTFPQSLGGKNLLFSNMNMHINIFWTELYLTQKEVEFLGIKIWLEIKAWPDELLGDLFRRLPFDSSITTSRFPKAYSLSDEHKAATAFFWLGSPKAWQALLARQMLISFIKKDPGYVLPKDAPEKVTYWKNWLVDEFQERFDISVFQLERATIKRLLPEIALIGLLLWAGCEFDFEGLRSRELVILGVLFGAGLLIFLSLYRIGPLLRLKSITRAMQKWRGECSS